MKASSSFADPTTLDFEPGVTVVVGPNGSGKSNVVDAIAWVLGAQGPSIVQSQKMDAVIFVRHDRSRGARRAEVTSLIDNHVAPVTRDLNEVTIRRTIFRNGDSEYALNGSSAVFSDVQELLSTEGSAASNTRSSPRASSKHPFPPDPKNAVGRSRRRRASSSTAAAASVPVRRLEAAEGSLVRPCDCSEVRRQIRPSSVRPRLPSATTPLAAEAPCGSRSRSRRRRFGLMRLETTEAEASHKRLADQAREPPADRDGLCCRSPPPRSG